MIKAAALLSAVAVAFFHLSIHSLVSNSQEDHLGPPGGWAISIATDPSGGPIYCAWHGAGILRSADGGKVWTSTNRGLRELTVVSVAVDPLKPAVVYVGTENGVFKSLDGGESWIESSKGLTNRDIWSIAVNPIKRDLMYAGTAGGGVYKSIDGGVSWSAMTPGVKAVITAVLIDANKPAVVYAASLKGGVLRSMDQGQEWVPSNVGLSANRVYALAEDPSAHLVYAGTNEGVFVTANQGGRWELGSDSIGAAFSVLVDPRSRGTLYAGTTRGVVKSTDEGRNWVNASAGLEHEIVWSLAYHSGRIFAGTLGNGIFASSDGGVSWNAVKNDLPNQLVYSVVVDPSTSAVFAATAGGGIYESTDYGKTWSARNNGLENRVIKALAMDPSNHRVLYAGAEKAFLLPGGAVFKSSDGGNSWQKVGRDGARVFSLAISRKNPMVLYAGTEDGRITKTLDSGTTWTILNSVALSLGSATSTAQQAIHQQPVTALVVDPSSSDLILAGTDSGIFKSIDGGKTWRPSNDGLADVRVRSMIMDERNSQIVYAGTGDETNVGSVFRSRDGGLHWQETGLKGRWILSLLINPVSRDIIAGTDRGIFLSKDQGETWSALNKQERLYVLSLAIDPAAPVRLYGGTEGRGVVADRLP